MDIPCVPGPDYPTIPGYCEKGQGVLHLPQMMKVTDKQLGENVEGPVNPLLRHHRTVPEVIKPQCLADCVYQCVHMHLCLHAWWFLPTPS